MHVWGGGKKNKYGKNVNNCLGGGYMWVFIVLAFELFLDAWTFSNSQKNEEKRDLKKNCLEISLHQEQEFSGGKASSIYQRKNFKKGEIKQNEGWK